MDCNMDHSQPDGRDLEGCNLLGLDTQCRNHHDNNNIDLDLVKENGNRDQITYGECQKNQSADRGITSLDGCGQFLSSGFNKFISNHSLVRT